MNRKADRVKMERLGRRQQGSLRKCLDTQTQGLNVCAPAGQSGFARLEGTTARGVELEHYGPRWLRPDSGLCCFGLNPSSNVS